MADYEDYERPTQRASRPQENPQVFSSTPPPVGATQPIHQDPDLFSSQGPEMETVVLRAGPPSFTWLVVVNGPWAGQLFRLNPKGTVLGRDVRSDIILDDNAVSDLHAKVRAEGEEDGRPKFYIHDLASTNGTSVNGEDITKCPLNDGDRIVVGQTALVFKQV